MFSLRQCSPTSPQQLHKQCPEGRAHADVSANQRGLPSHVSHQRWWRVARQGFSPSVTARCACPAGAGKSIRPAVTVGLHGTCGRAGSVACACATTCRGITGSVPSMLSRRDFVDAQWRTRARRLCWPQPGTITQSASGRRQAASATARSSMQTRRRAWSRASS